MSMNHAWNLLQAVWKRAMNAVEHQSLKILVGGEPGPPEMLELPEIKDWWKAFHALIAASTMPREQASRHISRICYEILKSAKEKRREDGRVE